MKTIVLRNPHISIINNVDDLISNIQEKEINIARVSVTKDKVRMDNWVN
jgi:hypothetical protein